MGVLKAWNYKEFEGIESAINWINENQLEDFKIMELYGTIYIIY